MIIGPKELLRLVKKIKLVENLSERELTNPEGAGFDIRLGEIYKLKKGKSTAFLGITERQTPDIKLVAKYDSKKSTSYTLKPGEYVLMTTLENVNLPEDICAHIYVRSTLYRCGIQFLATQAAPGYSGNLTFGLKNLFMIPVKIEMGSRVAHIQFEYVSGGGNKYRGQWQGGRVAATKKEKQV
jgi:deoxycytidine triphosphate deaminase